MSFTRDMSKDYDDVNNNSIQLFNNNNNKLRQQFGILNKNELRKVHL